MYRIGKTYKFELKDKIFYTGEVLEIGSLCIRVRTVRNEELILNQSEIRQAKAIESIGDKDEDSE